jgi:signal transduction histidine kinase
MRAYDWAGSPLGPVEYWPACLRTALSLCLHSQFPIVLFWGPELRLLYNDAYRALFVNKHPAALGQPAPQIFPEVWSVAGPLLQGVVQTGQATWAYDLLLPILRDGAPEERYFTFSYSPILDEQRTVRGVLCPVTETTERVQYARREHALRVAAEAARDQVTQILENMTDSFVAFDRQWRITAVNASGAAAMRHRREDLLGKVYWEEFPQTRETNFFPEFQRAMAERVPVTFESYYPPWGRWYDVHAYPAAEGGLSVFFRDMTAHKEAEAALTQHARDLERINTDLRQFAFVSAHDLLEPLRMVSTQVRLLATRYRGRLDAAADTSINYAEEGAQRMAALLHDILAYLELETETHERVATDCEAVLQRTLTALREPITASGAEVTYDPLPTVSAVPQQIELLFCHLLDNALKFRTGAPPHIHVAARREGREWVFSVRDNGIGLDPRQGERIFRLFQRLHGRHEYPGTGMGLPICKKIAERHGGRIWVESRPGEGTIFHFSIGDQSRLYSVVSRRSQ